MNIRVEHPNGFVGQLYGESSLSVSYNSKEVLHTGFRNVNTKEDLYEMLEEMPRFMEMVRKEAEHET